MKAFILSLVMMVALAVMLPLAQSAFADTESGGMAGCKAHCSTCQSVCEKTLAYCQSKGGKHAEGKHIATLKDCITLCKADTDLLSRGSAKVCAVCAEACKSCAEACEAFDDKVMKDCAAECRKCADSCTKMAG